MHLINVEYYWDDLGKSPYLEWFDDLDKNIQLIIQGRINRVKRGNLGDWEYLREGVSEIKIHVGSGYRLYFGKVDNNIILLLCAGIKKAQSRDVLKAIEYWNIWKGKKWGKK